MIAPQLCRRPQEMARPLSLSHRLKPARSLRGVEWPDSFALPPHFVPQQKTRGERGRSGTLQRHQAYHGAMVNLS